MTRTKNVKKRFLHLWRENVTLAFRSMLSVADVDESLVRHGRPLDAGHGVRLTVVLDIDEHVVDVDVIAGARSFPVSTRRARRLTAAVRVIVIVIVIVIVLRRRQPGVGAWLVDVVDRVVLVG